MGTPLLLLSFLVLTALYIYWRFPPQGAPARPRRVVDIFFLGLAAVLALGWTARVFSTYDAAGSEKVLVAQFAGVGAMGVALVVIVIGFLVRNFFLFRPRRY